MTAAPPSPPGFRIELYPNTSLSPRGLRWLFVGLGTLTGGAGLVCYAIGAWPIMGFMGLDVLLLWVALRASYRRTARTRELVYLTQEGRLTVERHDASGRVRLWSFEPTWLRVVVDPPSGPERELKLVSHGKVLAIGRFLSPEERSELARVLQAALDKWRGSLVRS